MNPMQKAITNAVMFGLLFTLAVIGLISAVLVDVSNKLPLP